MRWSVSRQRIAAKLQAIDDARKKVAEAQLSEARSSAESAEGATANARDAVTRAENGWKQHLESKRINLEFQRGLGQQLLARERELELRLVEQSAADARVEAASQTWRQFESQVRSGERFLRQARRSLAKRRGEVRDHELSDRSTWKWFQR